MEIKRKLHYASNFQRATMAFAIGMNGKNAFDAESPTWLRTVMAALILLLILAQVWIERSRALADRVLEDLRWDVAAQSGDPVGTLARWEYLDSLTSDQRNELIEWLGSAEGTWHVDDMPPVVARLFHLEQGRRES